MIISDFLTSEKTISVYWGTANVKEKAKVVNYPTYNPVRRTSL
jgi:hypothetical protein